MLGFWDNEAEFLETCLEEGDALLLILGKLFNNMGVLRASVGFVEIDGSESDLLKHCVSDVEWSTYSG